MQTGERGISFIPTRRSNVPCNVNIDTETIAQILFKSKECVAARKACQNLWLRKQVLKMRLRGKWNFHHEIKTDGVSACILYSRTEEPIQSKERIHDDKNDYPSSKVGIDPGKKNILYMIDEKGITLRYSTTQRKFETKLTRYERVLV